MRSTAIDRRSFLTLLSAAAVFPAGDAGATARDAADEALFVGARIAGGDAQVAVIDEHGRDRLVLPVEARRHAFAVDAPRRRAVAFCRSPGRHAVGFDIDGKAEPVAITTPADRHFFGHGTFTPDGRLMLASECDFSAGRGVTGVYDVEAGYRRIAEFDSGGVGPHEIVMLADGRTLCVANGGILTHPDYPRMKLNLTSMKPNLAYVDTATGEVVERVELDPALHQLSIRHVVADAAGAVWFGCQWEGPEDVRPPLVGRHVRGRKPELFAAPQATLRAMRGYVGAVAVDTSGGIVAASSPMGGVVVFWDAATGRWLGEQQIADCSAIAPLSTGRVLAGGGRGRLAALAPGKEATLVAAGGGRPMWDNHIRRVG